MKKLQNSGFILYAVLACLNFHDVNAAGCNKPVAEMLDAPIGELLETPISVASNVSLDSDKQPASVTVITREQLQLSAARTLNEALMTYVPGYFVVDGHSDTVGLFRGLASGSNSNIMMLINGHNINAERYDGMPDGIINGTNFDWIERIEIVRGPGSVTLGQSALQGVVNIVTRNADSHSPECGNAKVSLLTGSGLDNLWQGGIEASFNQQDYDGYVFVQQKNYEGQPVRNQGWPAYQPLMGDSSPQGGVIADVGHRLKRTENLSVLGHFSYKQFGLDVLHVEQNRDMYFFGLDSDGKKEDLTYFGLNHDFDFTKDIRLESKFDAAIDDGGFYTVQTGTTAGGNREVRYGVKEILHLNNLWEGNQLAIGSEARLYQIGLNDGNGENFIINNFSKLRGQSISTLNQQYGFVFPADIKIYSFFLEDNYRINDWLTLFGGIRFDEHDYWNEHYSPRFGAFLTPWQNGQFRISYQEGFRGAPGLGYSGGYVGDGFLSIPNLNKLKTVVPSYTDSTSVQPESLKTFELAFNQRLNKEWQFENVLFYSKDKNMIDVGFIDSEMCQCVLPTIGSDIPGKDESGSDPYYWYWFYANRHGRGKEQIGFETSIHYTTDIFNATASHSFVDSLNNSGRSQLPAIAQNVTRFNFIFKPWENLAFGANYLFFNSWNIPTTQNFKADGSHLLNASVMYSPPKIKELELSLNVKNILGENNLSPMIAYNPEITGSVPGAPALESTTFWLNFRLSFGGKF